MPTYRARYTAMEKKAFGNHLRKLTEEKGLSGAELARQVTRQMPSGKTVGRDYISWYLNGRSVPTPPIMKAIAKVLGVDEAFLLPRRHAQRAGDPVEIPTDNRTVQMGMRPDGTMDLMLKVNVPKAVGWKILQLVEDNNQSPLPNSR